MPSVMVGIRSCDSWWQTDVISNAIVLTEQQESEFSRIAQSRSLPAAYVFRARLILMLAEGASYSAIKVRLRTTAPTISRWKQRFLAVGGDGLDTAHPGQKPSVLTARLRARIVAATRKPPQDGSTHWSCRKLAAALGVSKDVVHRVWAGSWSKTAQAGAVHGQQRSRF